MNCTQVSRTDLRNIESEISFTAIIKSQEPNFKAIMKRGDERKLVKAIMGIASIFMVDNFPEQSNKNDIAVQFAQQIIKREPTWEIGDAINFFNFIQMRQDLDALKIFGNRITPIRLMEMVATYDEYKAEEHERIMNEDKAKHTAGTTVRVASDQSVKAIMGKDFERIQIRDDGIKPYIAPADEKFFNPKIN